MTQLQESTVVGSTGGDLSLLWLELTGKCNLECVHCYADSGPDGKEDELGAGRWLSLLSEAAAMGVKRVIFIGGEPTMHPAFDTILKAAVDYELDVEVYSNLTHIREDQWEFFSSNAVSLATSFYSLHSHAHDMVTTRKGSQARTVRNIRHSVFLGIPIRVGIVDLFDDQDLTATIEYLHELGVSNIHVDRSRQVGRAQSGEQFPSTQALCGRCADGRLAVDPTGAVYPCVFSRWLKIGDARQSTLSELDRSVVAGRVRGNLKEAFAASASNPDPSLGPCSPDQCGPQICGPGGNPNPCPPDPCNPGCLPFG